MRRRASLLHWLAGALVAIAALVGVALIATRDDTPRAPVGGLDPDAPDPFAWSPRREQGFATRATAGYSHVIYAKSPGGVVASARRTARWRPLVEGAARQAGIDPDVLEGIVLLESAGRPEVTASNDLQGAVGLTQILAETGRDLLGMHVDVAAARRLTRRIRRAERRGQRRRAQRLRTQRRRVDERFNPGKSLAATARYLRLAKSRFGRDDLAVVSYHMGIGNLQRLIGAYGERAPEHLSYTRLFFDATPDRHSNAYRMLSRFGDDSSTYWWRVLASRDVMRLYRSDKTRLARLAALQTAKGSAEDVLHPPGSTEVFEDRRQLEDAYATGKLRPFPDRPTELGLRRDPGMGELAGRRDRDRAVYRGLRPEAYALAVYMGAKVRQLAHTQAPLVVTSTVRDRNYQRLLLRGNLEATPNYSLHTTGYAFDVHRRYRSRAQAAAFQYLLERLQALNMIAWVREPGAIHVTVSSDARLLEPLLREK